MSKKIYGKDLAVAAFEDIESFFVTEANFKVNRELETSTRSHASCKGRGTQTRICLSRDFCSNKIETLADYAMSLLVVSHELAHYLNYHNEHADRPDSLDQVAIEARADNFGSIIMRTILLLGKRTNRLLSKIVDSEDTEELHTAMGEAFRRLHDSIYAINTSKNYPDPVYRVYTGIAGGLSFYYRWFMIRYKFQREFSRSAAIQYTLSVIRGGSLGELAMPADVVDNNDKIPDAILKIHAELQRGHAFMNSGLKPLPGFFLVSNFQLSDDQRKAHQEHLEKLVGIDTPIPPSNL